MNKSTLQKQKNQEPCAVQVHPVPRCVAGFGTVFPYKYPQEGRNEGKTFKQVLLFFQIKKAVQTRTVGSLFFRTAVRYVRL
jgi:hypothetical protein